jgi:hypothetical protein
LNHRLIDIKIASWRRFTIKLQDLVGKNLSHSNFMNSEFEFVRSPHFAMSDDAITFLNRATETAWQLYWDKGKLMINVPNHSFQIFPDNLTRFRPVNSLIELEFEFKQSASNYPCFMHIYAKSIKRATFEAVNSDQLDISSLATHLLANK